MSKINLSLLAATVVLLSGAGGAGLWAQCTDNLFTITSSSGISFPAGGGSTTISWSKNTGGSNSCPSFITTTASWFILQAASSNSTTGTAGLVIAPNPSSAVRTGVITVQSGPNDSTNFSITQLGSTLTVDATSLAFSAPGGAIPASQTINVNASGGAVQIAASATSTGNWLSVSVSSATTPAAVTVSVNPAGLAAGTYSGNIQIFGAGLQIPVNVNLTVTTAAATLSFNPAAVTISGLAGNTVAQNSASVLRNNGASGTTTILLTTDQTWLTASSTAATLGPGQSGPATVTASAANLKPGTYTGHVTAQGSGTSATLTVTFNVTGVSISTLASPINLGIAGGTTKTFPGVGQLAGDSTNVAISVVQGASYLSADAAAKSPGSFSVTVDATSLTPGNYDGMLLVQCTSNSCVPVTVQVVVTVYPGSGSLNFAPSAATVSMPAGSSTPQTASVNLENDGSSTTSFTISTDQSWLSATPASGTLAAGQKTTLSISTNAANLAPGSYTGHVLALGTGTTGTFTVNLTVSGANVTASPNPTTLTLTAATKKIFPSAIQLTGDAASVTISVTQGSAYLTADAVSQSPGFFSVTVDATKLGPGTYPGALVLHCSPGCVPVTVALSIVVSQGNSNLSFGSPGATLSGNAGSPTPQTATTTLLNAGNAPGNFVLTSDQTWLTANPSSGTLAAGQTVNVTISAASQSLAPGSYTGHVTAGTAVFTVNFTVAGVSPYVLPNPASFTVPAGTKQTLSTVQVLGGSGPISIGVTSGSIWLSADQAVQAPGSFNITIDATYLKPGSYSGALSFTCQVACVPFSLQINLTVTSNAGLIFSPSTVTITSYQGRPSPAPPTVKVTSSDGSPIAFTVRNPFSWLNLSVTSGTTPATLTLTPNLTGITSGASGNLAFTASNAQSSSLLPVTLNLQPFTVSATPNPVAISAVAGQHGQATLNIGTADGGSASLQIATTNFWLSVPANFTAPGSVTLKADATSLGIGPYPGSVTISCASANPCASLQVPVNLTVTNTPVLLSDVQTIAFPITSAGPTQTSQAVHLTSSDSSTPINYTIDPTSVPGWLSVVSDHPTTPATLTFSVPNPPTHQASANVKINSAYDGVVIAVTYTLQAGPSINNSGVVSAGGFQSTLRSGSWGTIYGSNLATSAARNWGPGDFNGNSFPTSLDGVYVTVGGQPAFVRSISATQINFQCPDGIGTGSVPVTVINNLGTSNTVLATVDNYAPAFFIGTTTGTGASARNYVAATESVKGGVVYIGPANTSGVRPAKAGEILTLWGTGFGPTTPAVPAGAIFSGAAPLNDAVQILIDGVAITPDFAGLSAAGLYQFNIVVPNLSPGDHKLAAAIGGVSTADGIWLSTQ